jgi:hypothetical protein
MVLLSGCLNQRGFLLNILSIGIEADCMVCNAYSDVKKSECSNYYAKDDFCDLLNFHDYQRHHDKIKSFADWFV